MRDEYEINDPLPPEDEEYGRTLPRWMSALAVGVAGLLFSALAIYAYHAGVHGASSDGSLTVIEADNSPIKEKPANPGGMQFPNQDKAVFGVLSGQQEQSAEHIAAAPEEPVKREEAATAAAAGGDNWVNDKLKADAGSNKEELIAAKPAEANLAPAAGEAAPTQFAQAPAAEAIAPATASDPVTTPAPAAAEPVAAAPVAPTIVHSAPVAAVAAPVEKKSAKHDASAKAKKAKAASGGHMIQLGAYRSQKEAQVAWAHIVAKHSALAGFTPAIQKADVTGKGTYYRLRVGVQNAKIVCSQLASEKQPCMPVN